MVLLPLLPRFCTSDITKTGEAIWTDGSRTESRGVAGAFAYSAKGARKDGGSYKTDEDGKVEDISEQDKV